MSQPVSRLSDMLPSSSRPTAQCIEDFLPELPNNLKMEGEDFVAGGSVVDSQGAEPHQPDEPEQDEEEVSFVYTEAEKDAMRALAAKGVKRPRGVPVWEDADDDVPNLSEIFDNYNTPHPIRISICRAYASYLASMQPKKPRAPRRK